MIPTEEEIDRADAAANPDPGSQRQAANQDEAGPSTRGDVEAAGEEAAEEEGEEEEPLTWSERVRRARLPASLNRPEGNKLVKGRFLWFIAKWDPEAPPGRRGRDAPKLHRHKTMGMLASKDPMYIHFHDYLFEQRMRVRGAVLTGASKAHFTYPSEKALFYGVFLPPVESESFSPQLLLRWRPFVIYEDTLLFVIYEDTLRRWEQGE